MEHRQPSRRKAKGRVGDAALRGACGGDPGRRPGGSAAGADWAGLHQALQALDAAAGPWELDGDLQARTLREGRRINDDVAGGLRPWRGRGALLISMRPDRARVAVARG